MLVTRRLWRTCLRTKCNARQGFLGFHGEMDSNSSALPFQDVLLLMLLKILSTRFGDICDVLALETVLRVLICGWAIATPWSVNNHYLTSFYSRNISITRSVHEQSTGTEYLLESSFLEMVSNPTFQLAWLCRGLKALYVALSNIRLSNIWTLKIKFLKVPRSTALSEISMDFWFRRLGRSWRHSEEFSPISKIISTVEIFFEDPVTGEFSK